MLILLDPLCCRHGVMEWWCRGAWRRKGSIEGRNTVRCPWRTAKTGAIVAGVEDGEMEA